jgi:hypothetical protein
LTVKSSKYQLIFNKNIITTLCIQKSNFPTVLNFPTIKAEKEEEEILLTFVKLQQGKNRKTNNS